MPYCALFRMDCAIRSQCTDLCFAFAAFLGALGRDRPLRARPLFAHSGGTAHQHFATLSLVFIIMTTGTIVGMICGYRGGYVDTIMMRISDVCLAFPGLVFALAIAALSTAAWSMRCLRLRPSAAQVCTNCTQSDAAAEGFRLSRSRQDVRRNDRGADLAAHPAQRHGTDSRHGHA